MLEWDALTDRGRVRRLRPLAELVVAEFPIVPRRIRLAATGMENALFRVDTDGGPYALRVELLRDHTDEQVDVELAWLDALARETNLDVVRFVPTVGGRFYTHASGPGVPGARRCTLFEWVPGRPLDAHPTKERYRQLGVLSANLHLHGATFAPPSRPRPWDRIYYWDTKADPLLAFDPEMAHYFTPARLEVLRRTISVVETAFERLDPTDAQVIHGDLHADNVHTYRTRMTAFDFEDVMWGHRVQDVAISLFGGRDRPDYMDLRHAFEEGYRSVAPWPVAYEGELEHFMAARTIVFINHVVSVMDDPSEYHDVAFPRLGAWVGTCVVCRDSCRWSGLRPDQTENRGRFLVDACGTESRPLE